VIVYEVGGAAVLPEVTNGGLELRATPAKIRVQILTYLGKCSSSFWKLLGHFSFSASFHCFL
jgi:hypothetical protein